jgi:hypothetical protein
MIAVSGSPRRSVPFRLEPRLEMGQQWEEPGAKRDEEAPSTTHIAVTANIAFEKAREEAPDIIWQRADIAGRQQVCRLGGSNSKWLMRAACRS